MSAEGGISDAVLKRLNPKNFKIRPRAWSSIVLNDLEISWTRDCSMRGLEDERKRGCLWRDVYVPQYVRECRRRGLPVFWETLKRSGVRREDYEIAC